MQDGGCDIGGSKTVSPGGQRGRGRSMCADMARMKAEELEGHLPMARIAVLYVTAYLYEHREQADHEELVQTLRSLLFGIRREVF